jgi:hypothetical protein
MNSPFVMEQAIHLAARSKMPRSSTASSSEEGAAGRARRIGRMYQYAFGREPTVAELADALEYVDLGEPPTSVAIVHQLAWQFGWGAFDETTKAVQFQPLASFTGSTWQGGGSLPDANVGWAMLSAHGGHPGDASHQAIRRWVAPVGGTLHIEGVLSHAAAHGDGVRGRIIAGRGGIIGSWEVFHSEATTAPAQIVVEPGETIDFVTDCRSGVEHDTFGWTVTLRLASAASEDVQMWDSASGFHGPLVSPLSRWEQLAQVLLMSNEFAFVD